MQTKLLQIKPNESRLSENSDIRKAGQIIRDGGLVAFPTETVYGLGANGLDPQAVKKIYQAKGRPSDNPLILHIADRSQLEQLVCCVSCKVNKLIQFFWPGPLTLVLKKKQHIPDAVTGGLDTVAVRMPSHPVALALIEAAGVPIAAPSANRSGRPSPTLVEHVIHDLQGKVEMIIDGGPCEKGIESTVLDMTADEPILLRPGGVSVEDLKRVLGMIRLDIGVDDHGERNLVGVTPRSPGMKYKHYSPDAELLIIEGESEQVREKILEIYLDSTQSPGILATQEMVDSLRGKINSRVVKVLGKRKDPDEMAARLFKLLREFDEEKVRLVLVEGLPLNGVGLAVMNRLRKAAGYRIIQV